ncbi:lipoyl synthase [Candidatus Ishikawella capsulata]|uniref:Lipoyl synthase n=1 Tax=Candidatus Ishikawaella capsulata Mpkobe TaxID=476281 RepID=C5WDF0_9ENTR|nr:lipoyl synthase [Candidatus Ishikawaella capsulata]BAH83356.1 lipoyl synthase [Candidatus Ishikawaella capsulata Mpkobe]
MSKSSQIISHAKYRGNEKIKNIIPTKEIFHDNQKPICKPPWVRIKLPADNSRVKNIKNIIRNNGLYSVCEEAACPNLTECFNNGTATFMILGDICTRRCPFCNVAYGRPYRPNIKEPLNLAATIHELALNYVVITSVNRDDLHDGGAQHFVQCIKAIREKNINIKIEILVPDFRGCMDQALSIFTKTTPDIFNHNLENVPRLYKTIRPGANYKNSLKLLKNFNQMNPNVPTKSGLMLGLGENNQEVFSVIQDLRDHNVTMLTLGQYLQPSRYHLPVKRYVSPVEFQIIKETALKLGFTHVACGPLVRSSYHANLQAMGLEVK